VRGRSIDYDILKREVDTSRQLYDILLQGFREIGVASNLGANNISIIDPARPPNYASKPRPLRTMLTAILLGLALGIGLAFLFESFDESIRSPEDVENKLGLPLLGTIPKLDKGTTPVVALLDPRSNFSEAYYSVRTALQFSTNEGVPSSLVVTSARPTEGKSTTSTAIAQHLARLCLRVLMVDSDLRNPSLHKVMSAENTHGFSNYLTGGMSLTQLAQETSIPGLAFIPCGPMPPNPAELLGAAKLAAMLREARAHYDVVLIDAPPVMGLADAPLLASAAAGTILVVEAGGTGRRLAKSAIRRLQVGSAHIIGILLTKFDARKSSYGYGYGYAYDYEYGSRPALKADS
jgi:capsular exopolysaccharide synthesis family protein